MKRTHQHTYGLLLLFFVALFYPGMLSGQTDHISNEEITRLLKEQGLEDIAVRHDPDTWHITYSDNVYRGPVRGIFETFCLLLHEGKLTGDISLLIQENQLPQIVCNVSREMTETYRNHEITLEQLMASVQISYQTDEAWRLLKDIKKENRSAGKIDVILYPQVTLNNAWLDKLYGTILNIAPALEVGLWKGASFTGQVIFPVWNNMKGEMDYVRPGMLLFRQQYRFPKNVFVEVNAGNFNADRLGVDVNAFYKTTNDRWSGGVSAGITGSSTFYSGKWEVSRWKRPTGSVYLGYNEPVYNLQFDIKAQRYIFGDYGVRFDCTRHFGEVSIGFYAMYSGGESNGGFHFALPLPGKKRMNRRAVRIGIPEYFDWEYEAQNGGTYADERLGRYYETRPDENRSQRYYNPSYMKGMLMKLAAGSR
jgi:hypothetical protein